MTTVEMTAPEAPVSRPTHVPRSTKNRSRVSNGSRLFSVQGLDGRSGPARRFYDITADIGRDLGGYDRLSELERQLIRRAAAMSMMCEEIEAALSDGDAAASFQKDYANGVYDRATPAQFDAILQGEAELRHEKIHEEEVAAGVGAHHPTQKKYTSVEQIYCKLIEEPVGRAIYKAARDAALGGSLEAPDRLAKVAAPTSAL